MEKPMMMVGTTLMSFFFFFFRHINAVQHYECSDPNQAQRENLSFENTPLFGKLSQDFESFLRR